jgi:hypothetical protein
MNNEQIERLFSRIPFTDEPPVADTPADLAAHGRRLLRRRRAVSWSAGLLGAAAIATGVAAALPNLPAAEAELEVAGPGVPPSAEPTPEPTSEPTPEPTSEPSVDDIPFPVTRQLLVDAAAVHLDPAGTHLDTESTNAQTGGSANGSVRAGTRLGWTIPGESGLGMVALAVTTPGYMSSDEYALEDFALGVGCEIGETCTEQEVPGTTGTVWVAGPDPATGRVLSVVYERPDGSLVGIGANDLFGNNSTESVSELAIDLDGAIAFVTDPSLHVDPDEAAFDAP